LSINERTGTELVLSPGVLRGGRIKPMTCDMGRCLAYYLEPLVYLAPFCKLPVDVTLDGVTNMPSASDPSVDALRDAWVPAMRRFLPDNADALAITVERRGYLPDGGGRVIGDDVTAMNLISLFISQKVSYLEKCHHVAIGPFQVAHMPTFAICD
jgi:RNA 3'-terminal phosphate cyclase-like protein